MIDNKWRKVEEMRIKEERRRVWQWTMGDKRKI